MMFPQTALSTPGNTLAPTMAVSRERGMIPSRPTKQGPAREDWDRHRATIKRLYLDEDKTLKEVISIMVNEYNLQGSIKMYKSRITKWKLDKNNKEHEIAALLRKKKERDAIDKVTSFRIRGRPVDIEEVFRYCKKKGKSFSPSSPDAPTPSDVSCWTPTCSPSTSRSASPDEVQNLQSSSLDAQLAVQFVKPLENIRIGDDLEIVFNRPKATDATSLEIWNFLLSPRLSPTIPRLISPPHVLLIPEKLFANIHSYFRRCLGNKTWISDDHGQLISGRANANAPKNPGDIVAQCSNAAGFFKKGAFVECRQAISKVFALIQDLLIAEGPKTLECFLASLVYLTKLGLHDMASMLRHYIAQMAVSVLPSYHPWCQICHLIGFIDAYEFQFLLDQSYHCVVDTFERELGPFHAQAIACRVGFIHSLNTPNDLPGAERQLRKLLLDCEELCGPSDWRSQYVMVSLGWGLNCQGRYAEAEAVGNYALQCAPDSNSSTTVIRRLELIGDSQYHQLKLLDAEGNIRETIDVIGRTRGRADPWAIENMIRLEGWLRDWGRDHEAAQLKVDIMDLLGPDSLTECE